MNFLTTPVLYGLAAIAIAAGLFAGVKSYQLANERADHAETKVEHAGVLQDIANLTAQAVAEARAKEQDWAKQFADAETSHQWELSYAQNAKDRVIDDLTTERLQLRKEWRGCQATSRVSRAAARAGELDVAADLRRAGAGDLVRIAASCDADIRAHQAIHRAVAP